MNQKFLAVVLLNFVNILGFSILIPVLPFVVRHYGAGEITFGLLMSSYFLFQAVGSPFLSALSDQFGRKPILMISQLGTLVGWIIFGIAFFLPSIPVLGIPLPLLVIALARITDGVTGGNVAVANAYLSDITTREQRTKAFGMVGAIIGIGMIVGPAIGGLSSTTSIGYLGTVIVAFCISLATLLYIHHVLPESLPDHERRIPEKSHLLHRINFFKKLRYFRGNGVVQNVLFVRVFFSLAMTSYTAIIVFHLIDRFAFDNREVGIFLLGVGVFLIFNQLVAVPRLSHWLGDIRMLILGQASMMFSFFFLNLPYSLPLFVLIYYFVNFGLSLSMSSIKSLLTKSVPRDMQGEIMGIDEGLTALASAIGPIFGGILYALYGAQAFPIIGFLLLFPFVWQRILRLRNMYLASTIN